MQSLQYDFQQLFVALAGIYKTPISVDGFVNHLYQYGRAPSLTTFINVQGGSFQDIPKNMVQLVGFGAAQ